MAQLDNFICGTFVSSGASQVVSIPCDVDYMEVLDYTQMATQGQTPVKFEWQRGFAAGYGVQYAKASSASDVLSGTVITSGGFTPVTTAPNTLAPAMTFSGITNASHPVVSVTSTATLATGNVVRVLTSTGARQIAGMPFTIDVINGTTFHLSFMGAPGSAATAGSVQQIVYPNIWTPSRNYITAITKASSAVVTMSVTHNYIVGQYITFEVPSAFGMVEMNGLTGLVTAINTTNNTITVNINSSAFTTFAFPASTAVPVTFAQTVPAGDAALQSTAAATLNNAVTGMVLGTTVVGATSDVIYWRAWKASNPNA